MSHLKVFRFIPLFFLILLTCDDNPQSPVNTDKIPDTEPQNVTVELTLADEHREQIDGKTITSVITGVPFSVELDLTDVSHIDEIDVRFGESDFDTTITLSPDDDQQNALIEVLGAFQSVGEQNIVATVTTTGGNTITDSLSLTVLDNPFSIVIDSTFSSMILLAEETDTVEFVISPNGRTPDEVTATLESGDQSSPVAIIYSDLSGKIPVQPESAGRYTLGIIARTEGFNCTAGVEFSVYNFPVFSSLPQNEDTVLTGDYDTLIFEAQMSDFDTFSISLLNGDDFSNNTLEDITDESAHSEDIALLALVFRSIQEGEYTMRVSVSNGIHHDTVEISRTVEKRPITEPPEVVTHPTDLTVRKDSSVILSISASGEEFSYQWQLDGEDLPDQNHRHLQLHELDKTYDSSAIRCIVTNEAGSDTSDIAILRLAYLVRYDGNDQSTGEVPVDTTLYCRGQAFAVSANTGELGKTGHQFDGWSTSSDNQEDTYSAGDSITMGNNDTTLYAVWKPETYKIKFDPKNDEDTFSDSVVYGDLVEQPEDPILSQHIFLGWYMMDRLEMVPFDFDTVPPARDVTIFARWKAEITVSYDANGADGDVPVDDSIYEPANYVLIKDRADLSMTLHSFIGWNTAADGSGTGYYPGDSLQIGAESIVLYAQWTQEDLYQIIYYDNTSSSGTAPVDDRLYLNGAEISITTQGDLEKTGYEFLGWNTKGDGSGESYAPGDVVQIDGADITLYADWGLIFYTVSFESDGGETVEDQQIAHGNYASEPYPEPSRTNYDFLGWYTTESLTTRFNFDSTPITSDMTLYAAWEYGYACPSDHPVNCNNDYCCEEGHTCCYGGCCSPGTVCCGGSCCPEGSSYYCPSNQSCYETREDAAYFCTGTIQSCR
ncbi:MAG: InlB B-repeat-containing protein [Chitinispirillaceae bacterium]